MSLTDKPRDHLNVFFKGFLNLKETASRVEAVNWHDSPLKGMWV